LNDFLQLIGSLASIVGVPLAIYLYLKGRVLKYADVRRDIVKRLSHQIGEGRSIGLFELNAIIDSLVRENRLRSGTISPNSVIEDLIAETVSSPLLDSAKKETLIKDLSEVHSLGRVFNSIKSDSEIFNRFIEHLQLTKPETGDFEEIQKELQSVKEKTAESSKVPEVFGIIAVVASLLTGIASYSSFTDGLSLILDSPIPSSLSLGVVISVIAGFLTAIISRRSRK
jgi:hypothetical protein